MASLAETAQTEFGRVDIVVRISAAPTPRPSSTTSPRLAKRHFTSTSELATPWSAPGGAPTLEAFPGGSIVNISSVRAHVGARGIWPMEPSRAPSSSTPDWPLEIFPADTGQCGGGGFDREVRTRHRHGQRRVRGPDGRGHPTQADRAPRRHRRHRALLGLRCGILLSPARSSRPDGGLQSANLEFGLPGPLMPRTKRSVSRTIHHSAAAAKSERECNELSHRAVEHRQCRTTCHRRHRCPTLTSNSLGCGCPIRTRTARTPASSPDSIAPFGVTASRPTADALLALEPDCIVHTAMADDRHVGGTR